MVVFVWLRSRDRKNLCHGELPDHDSLRQIYHTTGIWAAWLHSKSSNPMDRCLTSCIHGSTSQEPRPPLLPSTGAATLSISKAGLTSPMTVTRHRKFSVISSNHWDGKIGIFGKPCFNHQFWDPSMLRELLDTSTLGDCCGLPEFRAPSWTSSIVDKQSWGSTETRRVWNMGYKGCDKQKGCSVVPKPNLTKMTDMTPYISLSTDNRCDSDTNKPSQTSRSQTHQETPAIITNYYNHVLWIVEICGRG